MKILITGAAGFIGSAVAREALTEGDEIVILDKLTYAGHMANIEPLLGEKCKFIQGDIGDFELCKKIMLDHKVDSVMNLAAESHVDNSISGPEPFITTNVLGTFRILEAARTYWSSLNETNKPKFRFLHISTDEVFGELEDDGFFTEETPYSPNSPYSASKAGSDHLARAWHKTYGLPTLVTNCSNNYGPRQFPEKLIPRVIVCAINGEALPVYGKGLNVRDWIHVDDHARGLLLALKSGKVGGTYCFGGRSERKNIDVVHAICDALDKIKPREDKKSYKEQINFVTDRAGHDWRYAIDDTKAETELKYKRKFKNFEDGLMDTVKWYLENQDWLKTIQARKK